MRGEAKREGTGRGQHHRGQGHHHHGNPKGESPRKRTEKRGKKEKRTENQGEGQDQGQGAPKKGQLGNELCTQYIFYCISLIDKDSNQLKSTVLRGITVIF